MEEISWQGTQIIAFTYKRVFYKSLSWIREWLNPKIVKTWEHFRGVTPKYPAPDYFLHRKNILLPTHSSSRLSLCVNKTPITQTVREIYEPWEGQAQAIY